MRHTKEMEKYFYIDNRQQNERLWDRGKIVTSDLRLYLSTLCVCLYIFFPHVDNWSKLYPVVFCCCYRVWYNEMSMSEFVLTPTIQELFFGAAILYLDSTVIQRERLCETNQWVFLVMGERNSGRAVNVSGWGRWGERVGIKTRNYNCSPQNSTGRTETEAAKWNPANIHFMIFYI